VIRSSSVAFFVLIGVAGYGRSTVKTNKVGFVRSFHIPVVSLIAVH